jgi:hypothetical protein
LSDQNPSSPKEQASGDTMPQWLWDAIELQESLHDREVREYAENEDA